MNPYIVGLSLVLSLILIGLRSYDYYRQFKLVKEQTAKEGSFKKIKFPNRLIFAYGIIILLVISTFAISNPDILESFILMLVFSLIIGAEYINTLIQNSLFYSDKSFIYGQEVFKFRSIRTITSKNKRHKQVSFLDKRELIVKLLIAEEIERLYKEFKGQK
jgi:membrane protein CcdC involved in cytochrome C biogenesis